MSSRQSHSIRAGGGSTDQSPVGAFLPAVASEVREGKGSTLEEFETDDELLITNALSPG